MPIANITRNRKQFLKGILNKDEGERIINGSVDGEVQIIYAYHDYYSQDNAKKPKEYHMTLFPTNERIVVYQVSGFFSRDKYAQLPLTEIDEITYIEVQEKKRLICVTEFIAPDDSKYPSIVFKMDCSGHPDDLEQYKVILNGISQLAGVPIDNYTA